MKKQTTVKRQKQGLVLWKKIMITLFVISMLIGAGFGTKAYLEYREEVAIQEAIAQAEREYQESLMASRTLAAEVVRNAKERIEQAEQKLIEDALLREQSKDALQLAWDDLWKKTTPVTAENENTFGSITSCEISELQTDKISINGTMMGIPESDDDNLYLFNLATYQTSIPEGMEPIISMDKWQKDYSFRFRVNLNLNQAYSRLYDKFVVAIMKNGKYTIITKGHYITNPEAVAKYQYAYPEASSIKGLLVDPFKLGGSELEDLGVKQAAYNIPIGNILGQTSSANYPTIYYTYNGKSYAINGQTVAEYDIIFGALTRKGIQTTAILLNNWNPAYTQTIHPKARSGGSAPYYMFNAADESGVETLAAVATFLANRYSSASSHGEVVNWVVANEINARRQWNYMATTDVVTYTEEYAKGFRVFYNAIKSVNACARIYMPIDQTWNRNLGDADIYDGRDVLDAFNEEISSRGNIDWHLSHHPYPVPLTHAAFWNMPSQYKRMNLISSTADSPMVSMQNIHVVTDYLQREEFLTDEGEVRSVILGELGFTSTSGEAMQAAAFAYAYYIAEANSHIDGMLLSRQTEAWEEIAQGLAMGLSHPNGSHKQIYSVYKQIDTGSSAAATEFAKPIIGINAWEDVIRGLN